MSAERPSPSISSRRPGISGIPDGVARVSYLSRVDGREDWALLWPPEREDTWVVNLHGHGSHGDQLYTREDLRRDWLPAFRRRGWGIVTPNLRDNAWMCPSAVADLHGLLKWLRREHGAASFLFAGGSMGGTGNLIYATLYPRDVAGTVAMCPASNMASLHRWCAECASDTGLREIAEAIRTAYGGSPTEAHAVYLRHSSVAHAERLTMPVFVAHGEADRAIPVSESRALATRCPKGRFQYRELPGGDHDAPLAAAVLDEGLDWVDMLRTG